MPRLNPVQAAREAKLQTVAEKLLRRVERFIDTEKYIAPRSMKQLSGTLRDLKEIQMIRSEADRREQELRIACLLMKQRTTDNVQRVEIVFENGEMGV